MTFDELKKKEQDIVINKEAKEHILEYLDLWLDELSRYKFSMRKGIVRAIYGKVERLKVKQ